MVYFGGQDTLAGFVAHFKNWKKAKKKSWAKLQDPFIQQFSRKIVKEAKQLPVSAWALDTSISENS